VLAALHGQSLKSLNAASVDPVLGITLLSVENSTVLCWLNSWGSYHTGNPDILARFFFFFFRLAFDKSGHRGGREGGGGGCGMEKANRINYCRGSWVVGQS